MPRLHLVTGYRTFNRSDTPFVLYCGPDADAASKAQESAIKDGQALLAERFLPQGPVTRYGTAASLKPLVTADALRPLISVVMGEGEKATTIKVETQGEADFLNLLSAALLEAGRVIESGRERSQKDATDLTRLEGLLTGANARIATLDADLAARDERIKYLDQRLVEAMTKPAAEQSSESKGASDTLNLEQTSASQSQAQAKPKGKGQ